MIRNIARVRSETGLTVELVSEADELPPLARASDHLIDERHPGAVFRSSAWLVPWQRFSYGKQLRVGTVAGRPGATGQSLETPLLAYRDGWATR